MGLKPNIEKQWFAQEEHELSDIQKQFLYGSLLGDLCLRK